MGLLIWSMALQRAAVLYGAWQLLHFTCMCVCIIIYILKTRKNKLGQSKKNNPVSVGSFPSTLVNSYLPHISLPFFTFYIKTEFCLTIAIHHSCPSDLSCVIQYPKTERGSFGYSMAAFNWPPFYGPIKHSMFLCVRLSYYVCVYYLYF